MQKLSPISFQNKTLNKTKSAINNTQKASNNLERSPKKDILQKDQDKKKIIIIAGALIAATTALACFIKHKHNASINPKNVTPPKDLKPTPVQNANKADIPSQKPDITVPPVSENKAGQKLAEHKEGTQLPSETSLKADVSAKEVSATEGTIEPSKTTPIEKPKPAATDETEKLTTVEEPKKVPEAGIQPKVQIPEFVFDEKVFSDLQDYKKILFSNNPPLISNELVEGCEKEQAALGKVYSELVVLYEQNKDNMALAFEIKPKIDEVAARYKNLSYIETAKKISELKSRLDEIDPKAYERIVEHLKDKYGEDGAKYLCGSLFEEVSKKTFKTSPVYEELLKATRELGIEGKDDKEKIRKLFEMAGEDCLGRGEEGSVFRIPKTNLTIKIPKNTTRTSAALDVDNFQYVADISEYQAVNNVLARNNGIEIQEYIDAIKGIMSINDDAQRVISNMPQSAYDDYLARVVRINKAGRGLDTGGPNLLVDAVNCRFVPIDLHPNTAFEAGYRTKIDELGRNYIDPLAHTIGNLPFCSDTALQKKRIGKILKSIAHDTKNYQIYLFDTSFYSKGLGLESKSTIKEAFRSTDKAFEALGDEVDEAFKKMHQIKMQYLKSGSVEDKKKMDEAIEQFCSYIDEKLLDEPDLAPSELAKMQAKINIEEKYYNLKHKIKMLKEKLEHLSELENPTEKQLKRKAMIEEELEKARKQFGEVEKELNN